MYSVPTCVLVEVTSVLVCSVCGQDPNKWVILTLPRINGYGYHPASLPAASKTPLNAWKQKRDWTSQFYLERHSKVRMAMGRVVAEE